MDYKLSTAEELLVVLVNQKAGKLKRSSLYIKNISHATVRAGLELLRKCEPIQDQ